MENERVGEVHGAFILKRDFSRIDASVVIRMATSVAWIGLLTGSILAGVAWTNQRLIIKPLRSASDSRIASSEHIAAASGQVSGFTQRLAAGAREQAASRLAHSASMEPMACMTRRNAANATEALTIAQTAPETADVRCFSLAKLNPAGAELHVASGEVAKIVQTTDKIAFQTGILALSAAGEAGAGFSAVAGEVRALAQWSAQAAKKTAGQIDSASAKSEESVRISEETKVWFGVLTHRSGLHARRASAELLNGEREAAFGIAQRATPEAAKLLLLLRDHQHSQFLLRRLLRPRRLRQRSKPYVRFGPRHRRKPDPLRQHVLVAARSRHGVTNFFLAALARHPRDLVPVQQHQSHPLRPLRVEHRPRPERRHLSHAPINPSLTSGSSPLDASSSPSSFGPYASDDNSAGPIVIPRERCFSVRSSS